MVLASILGLGVAMMFQQVSAARLRVKQTNDVEQIKTLLAGIFESPEACKYNVTQSAVTPTDTWANVTQIYNANGSVFLATNAIVGATQITGFSYKVPTIPGPIGIAKGTLQVTVALANRTQTIELPFDVWVGGHKWMGGVPDYWTKAIFRCSYPGEPKRGHLAFLTSTTYDSVLGGLSGADAKCQSVATQTIGPIDGRAYGMGQLGGTWQAILSDSKISAKDRVNILGPVFNMNGKLLARNAADLWDGNINSPLEYDEKFSYGGAESKYDTYILTGTNPDGTKGLATCHDWTSNFAELGGGAKSGSTTGSWLGDGALTSGLGYGCHGTSWHLYCISVWIE